MEALDCSSKSKEGSNERRTLATFEEASPRSVVEAQDKFGKWFLAKVVDTDEAEGEVLVHFSGWSSRFDEWVKLDSHRLRTPSKELLEQQESKRQRCLSVGDRVQAKWSGDKRLYFGKITQMFKATAKVAVLFDDGVKVVVPMVDVRKRKQNVVAKTTLAATAIKDASSKALAEARMRRALKRNKEEAPADSNSKKQACSGHTDNENTTETESEMETCAHSTDLGEASTTHPGVVGKTPRQVNKKARTPSMEGSQELASPTPKGGVEASPDASKGLCSFQEQTCPGQPSHSLRISSESELKGEELPSCDLKNNESSSTLSPKLVKLTPTSKSSSSVITPSQPGSLSSPKSCSLSSPKSGSITPSLPVSQPKVIVSPVARVIGRHPKEFQDKEDTSKVVGSLRKRSIHKSTETDSSDAESTSRLRQHSIRLQLAPPESKKKRLIAASSMVTRTQKRVEKNIIKSARQRPSHLAPKEHVVVWDHNDFKCHFTGCSKSFRKETLLASHLRHYHNVSDKTEKTPSKVVSKAKQAVNKATPPAASDGENLKSPVHDAKKSTETVAESSSLGKQDNSTDTPKRKSIIKNSPRKAKAKTELEISPPSDATQSILVLTKITVPDVETASAACPKSPSHDPLPILKQENLELYRQRGNLRTVPKTSLSEDLEDDVLTGEETEEEEGMRNKDDVVHCICGSSVDEGFMIQCEQCLCWQHGECIGISQYNLPEKYLCPVCSNPPGMRQRMKYKFSQLWFAEGHLPSLPGGPPFQHQRATALSHRISDVLHHIRKMLHCTKIKIQALSSPNHPYLRQWAKECSRMTPQEIQALLLRTVGPTICSTSNGPPADVADDSIEQPVPNGLTHRPDQPSPDSLHHPLSASPSTLGQTNGHSHRRVESFSSSSSAVIPNDVDGSCLTSLPLCAPKSLRRTHNQTSSSELVLHPPPALSSVDMSSSSKALNSRTERQDNETACTVPVSAAKDGCAMETGLTVTTVVGGEDPEQVFSNEFGVQETSVFAVVDGDHRSDKAQVSSHIHSFGKVDGEKLSPSTTSFPESFADDSNRYLSISEESVFAPDPPSPKVACSGEEVGSEAEEEEERSSTSSQAEAIIAEAAVQLSVGAHRTEPGHWFNRLVLLDHINKVQDKILCWMDSLDKKIDSLPAGWSGDMAKHHGLLAEVQHCIQELEKLRKGCAYSSPLVA